MTSGWRPASRSVISRAIRSSAACTAAALATSSERGTSVVMGECYGVSGADDAAHVVPKRFEAVQHPVDGRGRERHDPGDRMREIELAAGDELHQLADLGGEV